jgi:hypothetical protein
MRIPEKVVQAQIVAALRSIGALVYVLGHPSPNDGRKFRGTGQTPGVPDLLVFVRAPKLNKVVQLWVEVKAEGGRLSEAQLGFQAQCTIANIEHIVGGLKEVYAWLLRVGAINAGAIAHYREQA